MIRLLQKIDEWLSIIELKILTGIFFLSCKIAIWAALQLQLYDDYDYIVLDVKEKLAKGAIEHEESDE